MIRPEEVAKNVALQDVGCSVRYIAGKLGHARTKVWDTKNKRRPGMPQTLLNIDFFDSKFLKSKRLLSQFWLEYWLIHGNFISSNTAGWEMDDWRNFLIIEESCFTRYAPEMNTEEYGEGPKKDMSRLIPLPEFNLVAGKTQTLFADTFLQTNRLDHVSQVMGYHPTYLDHFIKTQNFILRGDGPLPFEYRHYIAIMAAGRHQCSYLISLQKQEFILQGGDQNWLKGLSFIPQKLRNLYDINRILAHRPWLLNKSHIEKLTKSGKDSWSLGEVVHAIVILAHFHSLCSFVFSCGVNQEVDQEGAYRYYSEKMKEMEAECSAAQGYPRNSQRHRSDWKTSATVGPPSPTIEPEVAIVDLMQRMKRLSEQTQECTPVELAKRFENIETQSAEIGVVGAEPHDAPADITCFVEDPSFTYQDFAKRADQKNISTFRVQDYSWDDHGFSTVNRLYNDVGNLLDDKFKTAYNLTYYTMGGRTDVDTSRFRRAIWNYMQCLLGIRHDDYDYGEINALLERSLKTFIKSACCYPERVTKKDYDRVLREFKHSEKVHVNLMVLEARMQGELLYSMRTISQYMTRC
ncbi:hypothetical protein HHI36_018170 [Cryptolaemus montrouzieri]|uniref:Sestrin n=1 Tax=Cryptolaemus montrouzieri TaxID=559131 RepID=A0ABD2P0G4_9CUCU